MADSRDTLGLVSVFMKDTGREVLGRDVLGAVLPAAGVTASVEGTACTCGLEVVGDRASRPAVAVEEGATALGIETAGAATLTLGVLLDIGGDTSLNCEALNPLSPAADMLTFCDIVLCLSMVETSLALGGFTLSGATGGSTGLLLKLARNTDVLLVTGCFIVL